MGVVEVSDEIIEELWQIKDSIAREHDYDIESLVAHLQIAQHEMPYWKYGKENQ